MILIPYIKFGTCHQHLSFAAAMGTVCATTLPLGGGAREDPPQWCLRLDPRCYWGEGLGRRPLNSAYIYTSRHTEDRYRDPRPSHQAWCHQHPSFASQPYVRLSST